MTEPDWIDRAGKSAMFAFGLAAFSGIAFDRGDVCFGSVCGLSALVAFVFFCIAVNAAAKDMKP